MRVIKAISEDVLLENTGTCVVDRSYNVLKSPCYGVCTAPTMPYHWQMISLQFNSILCGRAIVRQSCHKLLGMCIQVTFLFSNAFRRQLCAACGWHMHSILPPLWPCFPPTTLSQLSFTWKSYLLGNYLWGTTLSSVILSIFILL